MSGEGITITIDGAQHSVAPGKTILEACTALDIYIPTLCTHKDLPPFGACRMCLVQVEKMRGFPPACSTPVTEGMNITTDSDELKKLRAGVLELILSEHPSSCIVCDEREVCFKYNKEPSKAGRTTGCRFCPNREECDLYKVCEYMGMSEFKIPPQYKGLPLEREDPFFDRDYNLCILCGRCVRVCNEIRGNGAIAFTNRGHETKVGTAFGKSHLEGGCRFCGACVDVCPTGALADKSTRWTGRAEGSVKTTCGLCSVGCSLDVEYRWDSVMNATPDPEGTVNHGQACVMGRFCIPTLLNGSDRLKYPMVRRKGELVPVSWDEALGAIRDKLAGYAPYQVGFLMSPFMTNEAAFVMQKYARDVIGSHNIDVLSGMVRPLINTLVRTGKRITTVDELAEMDQIIILGANPCVTHPVLNVPIHRAATSGARVVHMTQEDLGCNCDAQEHETVGSLRRWCEDLGDLVEGRKAVVIFGEDILDEDPEPIIESLLRSGVGVLPLVSGSNAMGAADMGGVSGCLPGYRSGENGLVYPDITRKVRALITTEAIPDEMGRCEFLVLIDHYPSPTMEVADVVLPSAAFTETDGTTTNIERRVQMVRKVVDPPGMAMAEWEIFTKLAGFDYGSADEITGTIHENTPVKEMGTWNAGPIEFRVERPGPHQRTPPRHRGELISDRVEELEKLFLQWGVLN